MHRREHFCNNCAQLRIQGFTLTPRPQVFASVDIDQPRSPSLGVGGACERSAVEVEAEFVKLRGIRSKQHRETLTGDADVVPEFVRRSSAHGQDQ